MGKHSTRSSGAELSQLPSSEAILIDSNNRQNTAVLTPSEVNESVTEGLVRAASRKSRTAMPRSRRVSSNRRPGFFTTFTASTVASAGITTIIGLGFFGSVAQANQSLSPSMVGGVNTEATVPAELTAPADAELRSKVVEAKQMTEANPIPKSCAVSGAQGIRTAFVSDDAQTMIMPIDAGLYSISSPFGYRVHPISGAAGFHAGVDFSAPRNTPIRAIADGVVTHAGKGIDGRSNNLILVEHTINGRTYESWYVHMYDDGVLVSEGDVVKAGDVIGLVGSNGNSTGNHLHLEIHDIARKTSNSMDELVSPLKFLKDNGAVDISEVCR